MDSITITFKAFLLEFTFDYLYYGTGLETDVLNAEGYITGYELPEPLTLTSGTVWLRFQSDSNGVYTGFLFEWNASKVEGIRVKHIAAVRAYQLRKY